MKPEIKEKQEERFGNTEGMAERYKAMAENMASLVSLVVMIGQEVGGEEFMGKVEQAMFEGSRMSAGKWKQAAGVEETEATADCLTIGKVFDAMDDSLGNFWDGYIERSPKAFEKRIVTCPVAEAFCMAPVVCERLIARGVEGLLKDLNPNASFCFTELIPKGDDCCCYRIEIND